MSDDFFEGATLLRINFRKFLAFSTDFDRGLRGWSCDAFRDIGAVRSNKSFTAARARLSPAFLGS